MRVGDGDVEPLGLRLALGVAVKLGERVWLDVTDIVTL